MMAENPIDRLLSEKDIPTLVNHLTPVASKCSALGLQLGLKDWQIKNIEKNRHDCESQLREILVERLNQEEPLSWRDLVTALRSDSVREGRVANQIESRLTSVPDVPATGAPAAKRPREQSPVRPHPQPRPLPSQQPSTSQRKPPLVTQYIDYVRIVYKSSEVEKDSRSLKWPPTPSTVYINLVCIDRTKVEQRSDYDEVTKAMVQSGDVDVVHGKKWPINFDEIAAGVPDIGDKRVVLVEGAPGVGKSTFAWEYCRRWERGEIAQQYRLVLLLRLRDERMSKAKTLRDLIMHDSENVRQAVTADLEQSHGSKTLILLEGFDELPDICRPTQSVFLRLICGELLPLATVMVTSRPWATGMFLEHYKHRLLQHIEIVGFTTQQISEYIKSVLPENEAKDLESYVKKRPQIRGCMYIPLNSAIVVTVYQDRQASGCPLPTTLTEQYTDLAQILLVRYLRGHPELEKGSQCIGTFKDLFVPCGVQTNFAELCKLAYRGIVGVRHQVQLIFKESELPADFDNLGFMDSVTELYVTRGTVSSHNFLHLTFQEYFAAVHISTMSPADQLIHFQKHKDGRLKVVLRFLAGITKLSCFSSEGAQHTFLTPPQYQTHSLKCDAAVTSDLINWMFEGQSCNLLNREYDNKPLTVEMHWEDSMLPMDYYSLGYCIGHSECQWVLDLCAVKTLDREMIEMLANGAKLKSDTCGRVVVFIGMDEYNYYFIGQHEKNLTSLKTEIISELFIQLKNILHLHELSLPLSVPCSDFTWPDLSSLRILTLSIQMTEELSLHTLLPHLKLESFSMTGINHYYKLRSNDCETVGSYIRTSTTLKELSLFNVIVNKEGTEVITRALASSPLSLERLRLPADISFTDTAADYLAQFIRNSTTLQYLELFRCVFRVGGLRVLAQALHHNSTLELKVLKELVVTCGRDNEDLKEVLRAFPDMRSALQRQLL